MGLASWAGPGCADGPTFERLVAAFERLDGSDAFVHPDAMAAVAASGKAAERAALEEIVDEIGATMDCSASEHPLFARITAAWDGESDEVRRRGVALDVTLIHIASMSNLAAALGWVLVDLLGHPHEQDRVHSGDGALAEQCALESTRLAQRSIMPRYVLAELDFDTGDATYRVAPGTTIATLLPLTNTTAGPGLHEWDPRRWHRHRLVEPGLACPQLVTAFGHGKHSCPAQPFHWPRSTAALHPGIDVAEADDGDVEAGISDDLDGTLDGVVDPRILVAECAAAEPGQQHLVGAAAGCLLDPGKKRRLVGSLQHQAAEWLPVTSAQPVAHRECRAVRL